MFQMQTRDRENSNNKDSRKFCINKRLRKHYRKDHKAGDPGLKQKNDRP